MAIPIATGFMPTIILGRRCLWRDAWWWYWLSLLDPQLYLMAYCCARRSLKLPIGWNFGYLGSSLPEGYLLLLVLCFVACLVPLGVAICGCKENYAGENGGDDDLVPAALCLV
ncbi:hypothetical protein L484_026516 [Morus notabilis]|uniref:Uncharacterized protein n=1 Tax=Morus notabilis TaxID=981085 RepID=W9QWG5_9ROSA|nr:hypothetical protein L484_026516 [Morus notabilis]